MEFTHTGLCEDWNESSPYLFNHGNSALLAGLLYFKAVKRTKDKLILAGGTTVFSVLIWGSFSMIKTEEKRLLFLKTICYEYDRYE